MSTTTTVWNTKRNNVRRTNAKSPIEMTQLKISLKR